MTAALITGGATRLGRELALALAARGFDIAVHYNTSTAAAQATVADIAAMGRLGVALPADLADVQAVQDLVPQAASALGQPLTTLINNAAVFDYDTLDSLTAETFDRHIAINTRAPLLLMQGFAAQAPQGGTVVNMLDMRLRKLTPKFMTYTLSKAALETLTITGAQALGPDIRVNGIAPGSTMIAERQSQSHFDAQRAAGVLERGPEPEDILRTLFYLLDNPAVTGQVICVDGGQHLTWQTRDIIGNRE